MMQAVPQTSIKHPEMRLAEPRNYNEYKFYVSNQSLPYVRAVMDSLHGNTDPYPEGVVDSIYYDSAQQHCYQQCLEGDQIKNKFRIRGYGDGTYQQIHHKQKDMFIVKKVKSPIVPVRCEDHVPPEWTDLRAREPENHANFELIKVMSASFGLLSPVIRVKYRRYRYRINDYRLTLDTNIEVYGFSNGIDKQYDYAVLPHHVLELKTIAVRPYLPMFGLLKLPQISFSKFYLGLNYLIDGRVN